MQKVELPLFGETLSFSLSNFEGPLELLLYLIQKEEIDLFDIPLKELTAQFSKELEEFQNVDMGGDFLWNSSRLLLLKSRLLLPHSNDSLEPESDFRIEILQKLLEYAKLKEVAKTLITLEEQNGAHFSRSPYLAQKKSALGLEEVSLEELTSLVSDLMRKVEARPKTIELEVKWEMSSKIAWFEKHLPKRRKIPFEEIFSEDKCKEELIVFFLALLELMKMQKILLMKELEHTWITHAEPL